MEKDPNPNPSGFDTHQVASNYFFLPTRYSLKDSVFLGQGSYGIVIKAFDTKNNCHVAIKKLKTILSVHDIKQVLREIIIMKYTCHENMIHLIDVIYNSNTVSEAQEVGDIYLVMEVMETDLKDVISCNNVLEDSHNQLILVQILRVFYYWHSARLIHRDFKPSNVLINANCTWKLSDFGMSRSSTNTQNWTQYVVTRYYRAPEILINQRSYSEKIDVWSIGCSFAELITHQTLFKGYNYQEQLQLIVEKLGINDENDLVFIKDPNAVNFILEVSRNTPGKKSIRDFIKYENEWALDLLEKMLVFNPEKRISIAEAIKHPYLSQISEELDFPVFEGQLNLEFDDDNNFSFSDLKAIWFKEIQSFDTGIV